MRQWNHFSLSQSHSKNNRVTHKWQPSCFPENTDYTWLNEITAGKKSRSWKLCVVIAWCDNVLLLLSRDLLCSQNALITFPQTRDCRSLRNSSPRDLKCQSLMNGPATVSLWISLSGTVLLIVNTPSSPTVAVCIISCLCSRFQPALSIHPANSELDKFCHLVRDFDTFLDWFFYQLN